MANEAVIDARGLKKSYSIASSKIGAKPKELRAVDGVDLRIEKGMLFGMVGESGCGKTTLGRCLLRLESLSGGSLVFEGSDITHLSGKALSGLRGRMQMVYQNPYGSFNPKQRIGKALREVAKVHRIPAAAATEKIEKLLSDTSLPSDSLGRMPSELSGGQLQRLALARALLTDPAFIVADEPVSALDVSVQAQILNLMMSLREKLSITMLFISHEMPVVKCLCDEIAVMYLGSVVERAKSSELFAHTLHPYTKALISAIPTKDPDAKAERIILEGDLPTAIDLAPGCPFAPRCKAAYGRCLEEKPALKDVGAGHCVACHLVAS